MPRRRKRFVRPAVHVAVAVVAVVFGLRYLAGSGVDARSIGMSTLLVLLTLFVVQLAALMAAWGMLLRDAVRTPPGFRVTFASFVLGWLSRYLPGPPVGPAGKLLVATHAGIPAHSAGTALAHEQLLQLAAAVLLPAITAGFFLGAEWQIWTGPLAVAVVAIGVLVIRSGAIARLSARIGIRLGLTIVLARDATRPRAVLPFLLLFLSAVAAGLIFHVAAVQLSDWDGSRVGASLCVFGIASLAGYVTPFAPSGAGVREAALVALLGPTIGPTEALGVAVTVRAVAVMFDGVLLAGAAGYAGWILLARFFSRAARIDSSKNAA
jgi:glycosyltransferase 2 family protein